jgi:2-polyprenyl-6-methoxyphenol hydroxylase-like FAD-dependent oxidoreductase
MRILIVGAGLAGPLLAQGLMRAGIEVSLYERENADQPGQGFRIAIAAEGDLALRRHLPAELYEQVLKTSGRHGSGVRFLDPDLNVVHEILVPAEGDSEDAGETGRHLTVDRQTLRRILLTGVDIHHGAPFERYELRGDGVRAYFGDGSTAEGDLLIGADGTHSRVRAQLLPHAEVIETGLTEIYGKTPLTDHVRALAPEAALDGFCSVMGAEGRFVSLAAHEFQSGGGRDYLMWVVVAPAERFPAGLPSMGGAALAETAARAVEDWHPSLSALVRLTDPATVNPTTIRTAAPVPPWETVPVTLAGDAAHTMIPQGTSAAFALKDAALLCRRITERTGTLLEAVGEYEAEMLEYGFAEVARVLEAAARNGTTR